MIKHEDFRRYFEGRGYTFLTKPEEWEKGRNRDKLSTFTCRRNHEITPVRNETINKYIMKEIEKELCPDCEKFDMYYEKIKEQTGHTLLTYNRKDNSCTFLCGNCGVQSQSFAQHMIKETSSKLCVKCVQETKKKSLEHYLSNLPEDFEDTLVRVDGWKNAYVECSVCKLEYKLEYGDIKKGHRCPVCAVERRAATMLERYGDECYTKTEHHKTRRDKTMLERYGSIHAMQNAAIFEKQMKKAFKPKAYIFRSGRVDMVQGYEPLCLKWLEGKGVSEDKIVTKCTLMPEFKYELEDGSVHRYYPDIMLLDGEKPSFIEVKSTWTYDLDFDKNLRKWECVRKAGYVIEVVVYGAKDNYLRTETYTPDSLDPDDCVDK